MRKLNQAHNTVLPAHVCTPDLRLSASTAGNVAGRDKQLS